MNYINTTTLVEYSESEIRSANPNTSFPRPFVPPEGYEIVFDAPKPDFDKATQAARLISARLTDKGHWEQTWEVVARFTEVTDDEGVTHTVAEQEATAAEAKRLAAVPASIEMGQARAILIIHGYMDAVISALAGITGVEGRLARSRFEFSLNVKRNDPLTQAMQAALDLTELQLDDLFTAASKLS
jgi:hypothetical protein